MADVDLDTAEAGLLGPGRCVGEALRDPLDVRFGHRPTPGPPVGL